MSRISKILIAVGGCLLVFMAVAYIQGKPTGEVNRKQIGPTPDLSNHPVYSKYSFGGANENVIDFGVQPLGVPIGVISEAISRDGVLKRALMEQGLEIRFHPFLKGADLNFFLLRGDLEAAVGGDMPAIAAAAVSDVLIVSLVKQGFSSIVAKKHMLIKDLKGKRIAYPFGSNAHYALLQTMSSAGLSETDVRLVSLNITEMADALAQGKIDAFTIWEPRTTIALAKFDDFVIIHKSLSSSYMYFTRSFVDQHPEAARQIVASQLRGMRWMSSQKKNLLDVCRWALKTGKDFSGKAQLLTPEQYAAIVKNDLLDIAPVPTIPQSDIEPQGKLFREFQFLQGLGGIPESAGWSKIQNSFNRTMIEEVLSKANKYPLDIYAYPNEGIKDNASR